VASSAPSLPAIFINSFFNACKCRTRSQMRTGAFASFVEQISVASAQIHGRGEEMQLSLRWPLMGSELSSPKFNSSVRAERSCVQSHPQRDCTFYQAHIRWGGLMSFAGYSIYCVTGFLHTPMRIYCSASVLCKFTFTAGLVSFAGSHLLQG